MGILQTLGKKAMTQETLVRLLIIIAASFIVGFFILKVIDVITAKGGVESCRLSIIVADKLKDATFGLGSIGMDLECPRKNIAIYPDYYTVDNDKKKYSKEEYSDNVKDIFAKEMVECWYKMGAGEINPLAEGHTELGSLDDICMICSHVEFKTTPIDSVGNLGEYVKETNIAPTIPTDGKQTVYDYIHRSYEAGQCYPSTEIDSNIGITDNGEVYTTKAYDIVYRMRYYEFRNFVYTCEFIVVGPTETLDEAGCDYIYN